MDLAHAPDDKQHRKKGQLKRNVGDDAGPNQSDQQRRHRQTGKDLFFAIEQHG